MDLFISYAFLLYIQTCHLTQVIVLHTLIQIAMFYNHNETHESITATV